jgi:uncharacterized membrane protein YadS
MVIALIIDCAQSARQNPLSRTGITFAKTLLRWAVALLGLRIALGEIVALGFTTAFIVIVSMAATSRWALLARVWAECLLWRVGRRRHCRLRRFGNARHRKRAAALQG